MTQFHGDEGVPPESVGDLDQREQGVLRAIAENGGRCGLVRVARRLRAVKRKPDHSQPVSVVSTRHCTTRK